MALGNASDVVVGLGNRDDGDDVSVLDARYRENNQEFLRLCGQEKRS